MMIRYGVFACHGWLVCAAGAHDWSSWRGPEQNGLAREKAVVTSWSLEGENLLWKSEVGGRTTPIVMKGRVYLIAPAGSGECRQERVVCLDADTGKQLWEHRFNVYLTDVVENRVGWTALVGDPDTEHVYAHGTGGEMFCFNRDGQVVWKVSLTETLGRITGYGGRLHTPILDEDRVIVSFLNSSWGSHAKAGHRYAAFDKKTGDLLWWAEPGGPPEDTTYSCPVVTVIDGRRMLIAAGADGNVHGMLARTGETAWTFRLSKSGLNSSVVADGKYVYVGHGEENLDNTQMGRVVCIDGSLRGDITENGELWRFDGVTVGYASPALAGGRLYVISNNANLYALDAKTGKVFWEHSIGRVAKGSPAVTQDGVIYVGEQNGVFHVLRDEGDKCVELDKQEFEGPDHEIDEIFGSPAIVAGRVYFMTRRGTYCLGRKDAAVESSPIPPLPEEKAPDPKGPLKLMMIPAEITLAPGDRRQFYLEVHDQNGRRVDPDDVATDEVPQGGVKGVRGTIDENGLFTADAAQTYSAGLVTARWKGLEAAARVRVVPDLPIEETFDELPLDGVPPGWVGVAGKTKVVELDGRKVLKKLAEKPSPPFMRVKGYAAAPIEGGYTVEADMMSTPKGTRFKADMGLINSRYRLIASGMKNTLSIDSWDSVPRLYKEVEFSFQTGVWYHVKFQVELKGDVAHARGKMWPEGQEEPTTWTIEHVDPCPHHEGSAGIYGYSPGTTAKSPGPEIFYDNFKVTRNP